MAKNLGVNYSSGSFGMGTEWLHDFLYDRFRLLSTNPLVTALFRSKPGDTRNGVVLTVADTNNKGDRVPTAQKWYLWALTSIYQAPAVLPDATVQLIYTFLQTTLLTFKIENLDTMFSAPLSYFRPAIQGVSQPAATINSHIAMEDNLGTKEFRVPEVLEQNAVWHLDIEQTAASSGTLDNHFMLFGWDREMYRQGG
jgi:hypothetical protein